MLNNKKSFLINYKNNIFKAFTLTEVVIASFISSMVLSFIFIFLLDITNWINNNKNEINVLSQFYDFSYKLNNLRNVYLTWWIIIDNTSTWSDVFLMRDLSWNNWILLGVIKLTDKKLDTDILKYEDRWIWFRKLSSSELLEIDNDINKIYDFTFFDDQIYYDLKIQDLEIFSYNSWSIYEMNLLINMDFNINLVWQNWNNLPRDNLKKININF